MDKNFNKDVLQNLQQLKEKYYNEKISDVIYFDEMKVIEDNKNQNYEFNDQNIYLVEKKDGDDTTYIILDKSRRRNRKYR